MQTILMVSFVLTITFAGLDQKRPDFSGRWVEIASSSSSEPQIVRQDATTLSVRHGSDGGGEHASTYRLDGVETRNAITSHGQQIVTTSKAEWIGERLRITSSTTYPDGAKMDSVQEWMLDGQGRLVIELSETMPGGKSNKQTIVFRKAG